MIANRSGIRLMPERACRWIAEATHRREGTVDG